MITWGYEILNGYYPKIIKMGIDQTKIPTYGYVTICKIISTIIFKDIS